MRSSKILAVAVSLILALSGMAFGKTITAENACDSTNTPSAEDACDSLTEAVRSGAEPRAALRETLKTKPDLCCILKCAVKIGIPLKAVYQAARDVCAQECCVARCLSYACQQTEKLLQTDEVCRAIKREVDNGRDAYVVTLEKVRQGHRASTVIMCTVAAGGDLDGVIRAARDLNVSDDVISRSTVDGCADPYRVSEILLYEPPTPELPKPYLSPSGF